MNVPFRLSLLRCNAYVAMMMLAIVVLSSKVDAQVSFDHQRGTARLSYPLASSTHHGVTLGLTLGWVDNLRWHNLRRENTACHAVTQLRRDPQQHGSWLFGVGGFAVQSLSYAYDFRQGVGPLQTVAQNGQNYPQVLLLDGYDDCGRTSDFTGNYDADEIRLLRADGGVVSLRNVNNVQKVNALLANDPNAADLYYTGRYYSTGYNDVSFADVEFDPDYLPDSWNALFEQRCTTKVCVEHATQPEPSYSTLTNPCDSRSWHPRIVRYHTGDGLTYVFREIVLPYGYDASNAEDYEFGLMPRVFYLDAIYKDHLLIARIEREGHYPDQDPSMKPGRSFFKGFHNIRVSYGNEHVTVEANGQTTRMVIDGSRSASLDDVNKRLGPDLSDALNNTWIRYGYKDRGLEDYPWHAPAERLGSDILLLKRLILPNRDTVGFQYEWCTHGGAKRGFRLRDVLTPATREHVDYHDNSAQGYCSSCATAVNFSYLNDAAAYNVPLHYNIVARVSQRSATFPDVILTETRFQHSGTGATGVHIGNLINNDPIVPQGNDFGEIQTIVWVNDRTKVGADTLRSKRLYRWARLSYLLPDCDPNDDDYFYKTKAWRWYAARVYDTIGDRVTTYKCKEEPLPGKSPYLTYKLWEETHIQDGLTNPSVLASRTTYEYETEDLGAHFGWSGMWSTYFGQRTKRVDATTHRPDNTQIALGLTKTHYKNDFRFGDAGQCTWNRNEHLFRESVRATDSTYLINSTLGASQVSVSQNQTSTVRLSGLWGVAHKTEVLAPQDHTTLPQTFNQVSAAWTTIHDVSPSTVCSDLAAAPRGAPLTMVQAGEDRTHVGGAAAPTRSSSFVYQGTLNGTRLIRAQDDRGVRQEINYAETGSHRTARNDGTLLLQTNRSLLSLPDIATSSTAPVRGFTFSSSLTNPQISRQELRAGSTVSDDGRYSESWDANLVGMRVSSYTDSSISVLHGYGDVAMDDGRWRPYVKLWRHNTVLDMHHYPQSVCGVPAGTPQQETTTDRLLVANNMGWQSQYYCPPARSGVFQSQGSHGYYDHAYNAHADITYVADANDVLHRSGAIDTLVLRLQLTGYTGHDDDDFFLDLNAYYWIKISAVGGPFATPVVIDEFAFVPDNYDDTTQASTSPGELRIAITDPTIISSLRGMADGTTTTFRVETTGVLGDAESFWVEIASTAEDAQPRLEIVRNSANHPITARKPDDRLSDFTALMLSKPNSLSSSTIVKVDQLNQFTPTENSLLTFAATHPSLHGRYTGTVERTVLPTTTTDYRPKLETLIPTSGVFQTGLTSRSTVTFGGISSSITTVDYDGNEASTSDNLTGHQAIVKPDLSIIQTKDTLVLPGLTNIVDEYGYRSITEQVDELGKKTWAFTNGLGQTTATVEVPPSGYTHYNLPLPALGVSTFEHDVLGRVKKQQTVIDDAPLLYQQIAYTYDQWGQVIGVKHTDFGEEYYKYDNYGQLRFRQQNSQRFGNGDAAGEEVTFFEYDDLGRPFAVGVARFTEQNALFPSLDSSIIRHGIFNVTDSGVGVPSTTFNPTVNRGLASALFSLRHQGQAGVFCPEISELAVPIPYEKINPVLANGMPVMLRPVGVWTPTLNDVQPASSPWTFEHFLTHQQNGRIAVQYDIPVSMSTGAFWRGYPSAHIGRLCPPFNRPANQANTQRNVHGRIAAVAYRDHHNAPYSYRAFSYDERGRVECMIKVTEPGGIEAVYYRYNSADQLISVHAVDALRQYATWYTYDEKGQLHTMRSGVSNPVDAATYGLGFGTGVNQPLQLLQPDVNQHPSVVYSYDAAGVLTGKTYRHNATPRIATSYEFDANWNLSEQVTVELPSQNLLASDEFTRRADERIIRRDRTGQPTPTDLRNSHFYYDDRNRMSGEIHDMNGIPEMDRDYGIDGVNMRTYEDAGGGQVVAGYDTDPNGDRTLDVPLSSSDRTNLIANNNTVPLEEDLYTKDGQVQSRVVHGTNPIPTQTSQKFTWGYNQRLLRLDDNPSFNVFDSICNVMPQPGGGFIYPQTMARPEQGDGQLVWGYTYSPSGERESKRLLRAAAHDSACKVFPYIYYSQGTDDETIVVYHGRQRFGPICGQDSSIFSPRHAAFYPVEFRAYGATGAEIVWEADAAGVLQPRFVDTDYQGSERLVRNANGTGPTITRDYFAFGLPTDNVTADGRRVGYLSKEVDWESFPNDEHRHGALSDLSARKYQPSKGAFVTQDEMWQIGPHAGTAHYSNHEPINSSDPTGYNPTGNEMGVVVIWADREHTTWDYALGRLEHWFFGFGIRESFNRTANNVVTFRAPFRNNPAEMVPKGFIDGLWENGFKQDLEGMKDLFTDPKEVLKEVAAVASNPEAWMPLAAAIGESLLDNALDASVLNPTTFPLHAANKLWNEDYYGLGNDVGSGIYGAFQILTLFTGGGAAAKLATVVAKFAPKLGKLLLRLAKKQPKVAGRGSTVNPAKGRFAPRNLREQLAVDQAMSNPTDGKMINVMMTDPRWPASEGWVKMQQIIDPGGKRINVHYVRNTKTGAIDDFKIVE